jgi:hypothetical protein
MPVWYRARLSLLEIRILNIYNYAIYLINQLILITFLLVAPLAWPSFASSVVLQWDPNTETDLAGYKVYYRTDDLGFPFDGAGATEGSSPIDVHNWTTVTINGLDPDRNYFFAITAYNSDGLESCYSNIVTVPKLSSLTINIHSSSLPTIPSIPSIPSIPFTYNDALLALRAAVGKVVLSATERARLDVAPVINGVSEPNGKIDAADAIIILSRLQLK